MEYQFPEGVDRASVWSLACHLAGQNPVEALPGAGTVHKLRLICAIVLRDGGIEWASVSPERPPIFRLPPDDAMSVIVLMATRPEAVIDWAEARRQLTLIDVRRADWERSIAQGQVSQAAAYSVNNVTAKHTINIPRGQAFVLAADIPRWIAEKTEPIPDVAPALCNLQKRTLLAEKHFRLDDLTPDDWALLTEIWQGLPDVPGIEARQFEAHREVFETSPKRPDWDLQASFQDFKQEAKIRQSNVRHKHFWCLEAAAKSGEITILTAERTRISSLVPNSIVSVGDARRYLGSLGFELHEVPQGQPDAVHQGVQPMKHYCYWSEVALGLADRQTIETEELARKTLLRQGFYLTPAHDKPFPFPAPEPSRELIEKFPALADSPRDANAKLKLLHHRATEYGQILEKLREAGAIKFYKPGTQLRVRDDGSVNDAIVYLDEVAAEIIKYAETHADQGVNEVAPPAHAPSDAVRTTGDQQFEGMVEFAHFHLEEQRRVSAAAELWEPHERINRAITTAKASLESDPSASVHRASQISKVPPPIEPLTGRGYSHSPANSSQHQPNDRPPSWNNWRLMPDVEAWQAVALSLGIEPDQVRFNRNAWTGAEFPFDEGDDFTGRLRVTLANLRDRTRFPGTRNTSAAHRNCVKLDEFARFAVEFARWPVPDELRSLASMAQPVAESATSVVVAHDNLTDLHRATTQSNEDAAPVRTIKRKGDKWGDAELRTLLEESKLPGSTQEKLGKKYGVERQRISALLKQAQDKFESKKSASLFPTAETKSLKATARKR